MEKTMGFLELEMGGVLEETVPSVLDSAHRERLERQRGG